MEIEEIIDKWKEEQDIKSNLFGIKIYEITEQNIKELKNRLIKNENKTN